MDGFGFNPQSHSSSRVGPIDQTHSPDESQSSFSGYRSQMPRHQSMTFKRELSERSIGMPSSAMTSRYVRIRAGIAELSDAFRNLGHALSPKESEPLRAFLLLLDSSHVEVLAQNLEELLVTGCLPAPDQENLKKRISSVSNQLQSAGKDKGCGFNDAQLLFTRLKDDLEVVAKILEAVNTSSHGEKMAVLEALNQIQAIKSHIAMLAASAQDDYQPMVRALDQALINLSKVELGLNFLNPVGTYGIVSSIAQESIVEVPPGGKPQLSPPEICDLQRSVFALRLGIESFKQELSKSNMNIQVCRQHVSGIMNRLGSLANDAATLEKASIEVQEKARTAISAAQIKKGLNRLSTGFGSFGYLLAGISSLFGYGQVWLVSMGRCCDFSELLSSITSGLMWSAKGFSYYAGVALLTPVFMVKKLTSDETPCWWSQPLPVQNFSDLPEGMEIYDPLKNDKAFESMYRYLEDGDIFYKDRTPSLGSSSPQLTTNTDYSDVKFVDELQMYTESLQSLEAELSGSSMKAILLADESLISHQFEMVRLENEFETLRSQLPASISKGCQETLDSCRELVGSCKSLAPSQVSSPYDSFGPDGSFTLIDENLGIPVSERDALHQKVIELYTSPAALSALFSQAEDIHVFLQQQMNALAQKVSSEKLKLITVALEQHKEERLKKEANRFALQAFKRRFHGRFKTESCTPSMKANPDAVEAGIQDGLQKDIEQVTGKLKDMLPREQMAAESRDWQYIKEKARLMALLNIMKAHLDDDSLIKVNLHYFTGHDFSEKDIEDRGVALNEQLKYLSNSLISEKTVTRAQLEATEKKLESIDDKLSELKSKLTDLYYKGWVERDNPAFKQIEQGRDGVRLVKSKIVQHYEHIVEPNAHGVRKRMLSELQALSAGLKEKLPESSRRADIDKAIALLESDGGQWNKEKWLHLNWMCNRDASMLRKSLFHYYSSVNRIACEVGAEMQQHLQTEVSAFDLCSSGDIEQVVQSVWVDWERHRSDAIEELLANPVIKKFHDSSSNREWPVKLREDALLSARQAAKSLSQGMAYPDGESSTIARFYQDVLKRGAKKNTAFDRAAKTLDQKQYQNALEQALLRMKDMENEGRPCFSVIKALAEKDDENLADFKGYRFDDICLWAKKKLGRSLEISDREELMHMFVYFRGLLMKEMNV